MSKTATQSRSRMTRQRIAELRLQCQMEPDSVPAHRQAIQEFLDAGLDAEALPLLRRLSAILPDDVDLATRLGGILAMRGDEAGALEQYRRVATLAPDSLDAQHNLGVSACEAGDYQTARTAFERKLNIDPSSFETLNDLAVIHTLTQNPEDAARAYLRCLEINPRYEKARDNAFQFFWENGRFDEGLGLVEQLIEKAGHDSELSGWRRRFADVVQQSGREHSGGMQTHVTATGSANRVTGKKIAFVGSSDAFLGPIMQYLHRTNDVRIFTGRSRDELAGLLQWADLTWFEWCDGLAVEASRIPRAGKAVCRLHSYEAFTDVPAQMNWAGIDRLILVSDSVGEILDMGTKLPVARSVVHNGVDPKQFHLIARPNRGKKIASVGYINYKKNPSLLLQTFKAIHDWDPGFELHIAGEHQDPRIKVYFDHLLPRLNLPITFHGWVKEMPSFYAQMDYVISTSLFESFHYSVAEGMLSGCLPLVHSWKGADRLYPSRSIFDTPDQAIEIIKRYLAEDTEQIANDHRRFIVERYNWADRLSEIDKLLAAILSGAPVDAPRRRNLASLPVPTVDGKVDCGLVSIVIVTRNDASHVRDAVATALSQLYSNVEVIVCDDGSTDDTEAQLAHFGDKIKVIRQVRRGLAAALNNAIQHCRGEFIAPLLGYEAFAPDKIARQVQELAANSTLYMVSCGTDLIEETTKPVPAGFDAAIAQWRGTAAANPAARIPISSVLFRRSLFDRTGWFDEGDPELPSHGNPVTSIYRKLIALLGPESARTIEEPLVYVRPDPAADSHNTDMRDSLTTDTGRWVKTVHAGIDRARLSQPSPSPANPPKTGAKIVFVGAVDPGGQMAMWSAAINRFTAHQARVLTHSETLGYSSDLVLKRRGHGKPAGLPVPSAMKVVEEAEQLAAGADLIIFASGVAPGCLRHDAKLTDTDEQDYGTIHWPDLKPNKRHAALLCGTPSVRRNLNWYRNHLAAKGWPVLTCEPEIHARLAETHFFPRLLGALPKSPAPVLRSNSVVGIIQPGELELSEGGAMIRDAAATLKQKYPHVAFGRYQDMAWADVIEMKRRAHIGIDCVSVGSGHFGLTSLENSALGMVNIVYVDPYARALIAQTLGTTNLPWETPATQTELTSVLEKYLADPDALEARMAATSKWFETYWAEERIASVIAGVLEKL